MPPAPAFRRFARAVRWRYVLARGVERVGVSVLIAAAGAVLLLPVLWWYSVGALPVVFTLLAGGVAVGVIAACLNWPTTLTAVMEADRQLKLADLLGTALVVTDRDGPWAATILTLADGRCRQVSANSVIFRRWGGRAWGGIAVAVTLTLAAGWLLNQPASLAMARAEAREVFSEAPGEAKRAERRADLVASRPKGLLRMDGSGMASSEKPDSAETSANVEEGAGAKAESKSSGTGTGAGGDAGQGKGMAQTAVKPKTTPVQPAVGGSDAASGRVAAKTVNGGPGGGASADGGGQGASHPGVVSSAGSAGRPAPAWQAPDGQPADAGGQWRQRLDRQPELDAYRDLVTAFFERQ